MRADPPANRLLAALARQTPAAASRECPPQRSNSWLRDVVSVVARTAPQYRAARIGPPLHRWRARGSVRAQADRLVREVARAVVARVAPGELPAFRAVADVYLRARPVVPAGNTRLSYQPHGGPAADLTTTVVLLAVSEVVTRLVGIEARGYRDDPADGAAPIDLLLAAASDPTGPVPPLTDAVAAQVARIVHDVVDRAGPTKTADRAGVPATADLAVRITDALLTAEPPTQEGTP